jgi:hypothetical protein
MFNAGISSEENLYRAMLVYANENFDTSVEPLDKSKVGQIAKSAAANFEAKPSTAVSPDWVSPAAGELTEVLAQLPDDAARAAVLEAWATTRQELFEIRLGLEEVTDEETGKTKKVHKPRIQVDDEVLASVYRTLRETMGGKFFVDAYPYIFLPKENRVYKFHNDEAVYRLLTRFGLRRTQHDYQLVEENLHHEILMYGTATHIEKFGCMRGEAIYINDGQNNIIKITTDSVLEVPNGTDDVYMLNKHLTPWPALETERLARIAEQLAGRGGWVTDDSKLCQHLNAYFDEGKLNNRQ